MIFPRILFVFSPAALLGYFSSSFWCVKIAKNIENVNALGVLKYSKSNGHFWENVEYRCGPLYKHSCHIKQGESINKRMRYRWGICVWHVYFILFNCPISICVCGNCSKVYVTVCYPVWILGYRFTLKNTAFPSPFFYRGISLPFIVGIFDNKDIGRNVVLYKGWAQRAKVLILEDSFRSISSSSSSSCLVLNNEIILGPQNCSIRLSFEQ